MKPSDLAFCSHGNEWICQMGRKSRRPAQMELCYRPKRRTSCVGAWCSGKLHPWKAFTLRKFSPSEGKTGDRRLTYTGAGTTLYGLLKAQQPFYTCKYCLSLMASPDLEMSTSFSSPLGLDKSRPRKAVKDPS